MMSPSELKMFLFRYPRCLVFWEHFSHSLVSFFFDFVDTLLKSEIATVDEGEGVHLVENLSEGSVVADGLAFAIMGECVFEEQGFAWCFRLDNFGDGLAFFSAWAFHGGGEKEGGKRMTSRKYNPSCPIAQLGFAAPEAIVYQKQ